ncbi:hypothetical protein L7F22_051290, partial [Adiantum nelumboides]|nr:hypothetical protein [Adiantum nelumboides]
YPSVHIMIPCYNEPTDVAQESILAALALDYPKKISRSLYSLMTAPITISRHFMAQLKQVESQSDQLIYLTRTKVSL